MATTQKLDVRAYPIAEPKSSTVAFASVTINDIIGINGIRVVNGENGLFVAMPQTKDSNKEYRDIAFPVTKDLRLQLNEAVLDCYAAEKEKSQERASVKGQIQQGKNQAIAQPAKETPAKAKSAPSAARASTSKAKSGPEL
jgi:stage V sporulation protein G